jgi:hypothetical protein
MTCLSYPLYRIDLEKEFYTLCRREEKKRITGNST